jgi:hypothetical protein
MKSSINSPRKISTLPLAEGEEVIISYTASYDVGSSVFSLWRLGNLYLTKKRLFFAQARKLLFQIPLREIQKMEIIERRWILSKKVEQLFICWGNSPRRKVFIAVKNPQRWKGTIESLIDESIRMV